MTPLHRFSRRRLLECAAIAVAAPTMCTQVRASRRVGCIIDCSGSYSDDLSPIRADLVEIVSRLREGDTFFVSFIGDCSATNDLGGQDHVIGRGAFRSKTDVRDLRRHFEQSFQFPTVPSRYTDIRGAMHLAADMHANSDATSGLWFLFSDLRITYAPGCLTASEPLARLNAITVVGANIAREAEEAADYAGYRARIAAFAQEIETACGAFVETGTAIQVLDRVMPTAAEELRRNRA